MKEIRICWICYGEEEIDPEQEIILSKKEINQDESIESLTRRQNIIFTDNNSSSKEKKSRWIRPCQCKGSMAFVHRKCFRSFIIHTKPGMECMQCKTSYYIIIKEYYFIKIYEMVYSFSLIMIFALAVGICVLCAYAILFSYGALLMFITLGKDAIIKMFFEEIVFQSRSLSSTGVARALIAFPLIPIGLLLNKPYFYGLVINLLVFMLIFENSSFRISNLIFSISPIIFFIYTVLINSFKEYVIPNSDDFFSERVYTINSFFAQFPFPAKEGIIVLVMPFLSASVGFFLFNDTSVSFTFISGLLLLFLYDSLTTLYIYLIKRRQEKMQIEEYNS